MKLTPPRIGLIAGLLAGIALAGVLYLASTLIRLSFVPYDLADLMIRATPGQIATQGIEALGTVAKMLVKLGAVAAFIAIAGGLGGIVGYTAMRRRQESYVGARNLAAFAIFAVMIGISLLNHQVSQPSPLAPLPFLLLIVLALAWGALFDWIYRRAEQPVAEPDAPAVNADRRAFLLKSGAAVITIAVGSTALAELFASEPTTAASTVTTLPRPKQYTPEQSVDLSAFKAPAGVRERITPQKDLYYVSSRTRDPRVDAATYKLTIQGNVDNPITLSLDQLMQLPRVDQTSTLECISNEVGGNLIGNVRWTGTRLADLIQQARPRAGSLRLALYGADGYVDSIAIEDALKPTTLVVYAVDGQPLQVPHGYPVRLIVPNIYGMKNCKWLQKIEVVTYDLQGYWQERGWSQPAVVKTTSVTDTAGLVSAENGVVPIGGIAFAGARGIEKVEVQIDNGQWAEATLEPESSPLQWRRWRYDVPVASGTHTVNVRAVDGTGALQSEQIAAPHPDGASGYHTVRISVR